MKITIEGMDGVGKSTIAKNISEKYNFKYLGKPLQEIFNTKESNGYENLENISRNIYNLKTDILKAWFFGLGNLYSFDQYKEENLVIDRHFSSNYFWNGNDKSDAIFKLMLELVPLPDINIVLYASAKTRMERLYKRNPFDYDLTDTEKHINGYDRIFAFYEKFNIPYILINTENKTELEVLDEVFKIIDDHMKDKKIKCKQ